MSVLVCCPQGISTVPATATCAALVALVQLHFIECAVLALYLECKRVSGVFCETPMAESFANAREVNIVHPEHGGNCAPVVCTRTEYIEYIKTVQAARGTPSAKRPWL